MLADRPGSGIEQPVDRVLFVLLLLVHHRAVLPTGIAIVLRGDTVAVFGDVAVGGQKVFPTALALAGRVAVVQSVQKIVGVEICEPQERYPFHKHHFFFAFRAAGEHIGGSQFRMHRERLYVPALQSLQFIPKFFTAEAVMRGHGEISFVPLFEVPQIVQFKESASRDEVQDRHRDARDRGAEYQEFLLKLRVRCEYFGKRIVIKQDVDAAQFFFEVAIAKGRIPPNFSCQINHSLPQHREHLSRFQITALYDYRKKKGGRSASPYQFLKIIFGNVQNGRSHKSRRELLLLIKNFVIPNVNCDLSKIIVLLCPQRHSIAPLSHICFASVLRYSHSIKKHRIIK